MSAHCIPFSPFPLRIINILVAKLRHIDTFFFVIYFAFYLSAKKRRGNKENHYLVLSKMTILKDANEKFLSTTKNTLHDRSTFLVLYSAVLNLQSKEENQRFTSLIARFILEQRSPNTPKTPCMHVTMTDRFCYCSKTY